MSASNASAKKRRAMISPSVTESMPNVGGRPYNSPVQAPNTNGQNTNPPQSQQGFTLQQVISVIDKRLINLEKSIDQINKEHSHQSTETITSTQSILPDEQADFNKQANENFKMINDNLNEYDNRFEILANEIADIKTIVMKLQSYTLDVNKMLLEERQNQEQMVDSTQPNESTIALNDIYSFSTHENMSYNLLPTSTNDNVDNNNLPDTQVSEVNI